MSNVDCPVAENFSLIRGGPVYRLSMLIGQAETERPKVVTRAIFASLLCWFPLLVLTAVQGLAIGTRIKVPFVFDYAVHLRFLIALPILILAESPVDLRWQTIVLEFLRARLVDKNDCLQYELMLQKIMRLRDRMLPEIAMLLLAYLTPLLLGALDWQWQASQIGMFRILVPEN